MSNTPSQVHEVKFNVQRNLQDQNLICWGLNSILNDKDKVKSSQMWLFTNHQDVLLFSISKDSSEQIYKFSFSVFLLELHKKHIK